ncbi:superoxide dismutase [Amylocarpus encephaloides]|uniref:superoxide dismutase n=1 Tax=Amylocarpus encephaloides TaxID=45428 RepID=A0A9P7YQ14_9HELO|nr:superoxide dismutase [Amylocarpus encephaloides]
MHTTMITSVFLTALLTCVRAQDITTGALGNATVVDGNPLGVTYVATLPEKSSSNPNDPRGDVKGVVTAAAGANGVGVKFDVSFSNLPTSGGPFLYHLHVAPVPADGNCTKTLAHLDPFQRGEDVPCDMKYPETCQVGDNSGKHGKITSDPFTASYTDDFVATRFGLGSFFGNRSFVIHFANKTRISCANFTMVTANSTGGGNGTSTGTPPQFTGGVTKNAASAGVAMAAAAFALML